VNNPMLDIDIAIGLLVLAPLVLCALIAMCWLVDQGYRLLVEAGLEDRGKA